MKGILKIYHPEETLKYHIQSSYCKSVYTNEQNLLELEIITDDNLDHVEDDSLQYNFPQLAFRISDYPIEFASLQGKNIALQTQDVEEFSQVELYDDEEAFLTGSELTFSDEKEYTLFWQGSITDFFTGSEQEIPFKLKCDFKKEEIKVLD